MSQDCAMQSDSALRVMPHKAIGVHYASETALKPISCKHRQDNVHPRLRQFHASMSHRQEHRLGVPQASR